MKTVFTLLFVFFLYSANAANYYFSAVSGNDSRSPVQAQNPATPWKTLQKLNSFFKSLHPGDSVLLKRSETFFGSITVNKSGAPALPIVISAYGTGNKPIITSLVTLDSWVSKGNGIWESHNSSLGKTVNMVVLNDEVQQIGRYPNSDAANKGYLNLESHYRTNSITDNELTSKINWKGAEVVIRMRRWVIDINRIKAHSGGKITYAATSDYKPKDDYGYFIQDDIRTLDKFGEWYYKPSGKKMSIYFGADVPSSATIQATTFENLISASNCSNVVFDNLNVKGANADVFNIINGSNMNIKNCDVSFAGGNGVAVKFHKSLKIENCTIANSNDNGINLGYSGAYAIIRNNKIINTSVFAGMGGSGDGKGFGIQSNGNGSIIEYNEILNTGYAAINFNGDSTIVKNNLIDGYCMTKDDGSGIYTFTGSVNTNRRGRKVVGNIIMNGIGVPEGTNDKNPLAEGIYLDDNASGVEISGNTVANIPGRGIFLHNARGVTITNNTLFNNVVQLSVTHDTKGDAVRNCIISKNNFFLKLTKQNAVSLKSIANDNNLMGRIDSNYYARPLDENSASHLDKVQAYEANATVTEFDDPIRFVFNSSRSDKTVALDGNYADVRNNKYSNKIVLQPFTSAVLIEDDGKVENKAPKVSIITPELNASYKAHSTIRIRAAASDDDGSIKKVEFYNGTTLLRTERFSPYTHSWLNVPAGNYTLIAKATDDSGHVTTSESVEISVVSNGYPSVGLTSPAQRTRYKSGTTISISAYANDADGSIKKVEFYEGTTLLHTGTERPYSWNWSNVSAGDYTITAKATDNSGHVTASESVTISVAKNANPTVSLTSPAQNATYKSGAIINIRANASDADGSIKKVEFYEGKTLLHAEKGRPYSWSWSNVKPGNYTITARATDNSGNVTSSKSVTVTVSKKARHRSNGNENNDTSVAINNIYDLNIKPETVSKEEHETYTLKLFPNPAVNKIQINIDGLQISNKKVNLSIRNLSGIIVKSIPVIVSGNTIEADVSFLRTGMYIVSIVSDDFIISRKFVKN